VNSLYTNDAFKTPPEFASVPEMCFLSQDSATKPKAKSAKLLCAPKITQIAGLSFLVAFSPMTAIPDPWLLERRRRDAAITISVFQEVYGRAISRIEALRIARQIIEQAEKERLAIADFEAARGIHWGD
jgi:hypothetical protein